MSTLAERLVNRLSRREPTRRGFLGATTLGAAALASHPWDYVTKPQDAYSSVCGPGAACNDGWSVMCCTINHGHNTCPPGTFAGGWWKADRSSYCGGRARYYIDCNARPDSSWRCHCSKRTCDRRRVACNVFRYGQCNTQIKGITAVVCRRISCVPPWELYPGTCSSASATDNNTAEHNAPCLTARNTFRRLPVFPAAPDTLAKGHSLRGGHRLTAENRHTTLLFTTGGNLELRNERGVIWQSHTGGPAAGGRAELLPDGNFVIFDAHGRGVWGIGRPAPSKRVRAHVRLRNGGELVVVHNGRVVWHTNTHTP